MGTISLRIPDFLYEQVKVLADFNRRSVNSEIVSAIERSTVEALDARRQYELRKLQLFGPPADEAGQLRLQMLGIDRNQMTPVRCANCRHPENQHEPDGERKCRTRGARGQACICTGWKPE